MPVLLQCLSLIHKAQRRAVLVLTNGAMLTMRQEMGLEAEQLAVYADAVYAPENIGAPPASGSLACGRHADCTLQHEDGGRDTQRLFRQFAASCSGCDTEGTPPACIGGQGNAAEPHTPENMYELAMIPSVHIMPLMMTFYHHPKTTEEMVYHCRKIGGTPLVCPQRSIEDGRDIVHIRKRRYCLLGFLHRKPLFFEGGCHILLYGGERPHIGCTVMAQPRPSLADPQNMKHGFGSEFIWAQR